NMTVMMDLTKSVMLHIDQDTGTTPTFYQFNVYNLVLDTTSNAWGAHVAYVAQSTANTVTLPNDVFEDGKVYMIRGFSIVGGFPGFASGDLTMRQLPYSIAYLDGGIFTAKAQ